jgi:DNA-binding transcriptional MerR regulator
MPEITLRIGELARRAGTSPDTLRHYERVGVLPAPRRAANGYRVYPESAVQRVVLVKRALAIGFTLDELRSILAERDRGGAPCREVRALAARKLSALEAWLFDLERVRDRLRHLLEEWDGKLAATPARRRAGLLEALGDGPPLTARLTLERVPGSRTRGQEEP